MAGDRTALEALVDHYYGPVYKAAYRILGDVDGSADVTQATFVSVFENLHRFDASYKFFSWIYRIAVNHALERGKRQRLTVVGASDDQDGARGTADEEPEQDRSRSEEQAILSRTLMELSEDHRIVIILRHYSEFSYDEMAEVLGLPVKTVKSRLFSARQALKARLEDNGIDR